MSRVEVTAHRVPKEERGACRQCWSDRACWLIVFKNERTSKALPVCGHCKKKIEGELTEARSLKR